MKQKITVNVDKVKKLTFDFWRKLGQMPGYKESQLLIQIAGQRVNIPGANSCPTEKEQWAVVTVATERGDKSKHDIQEAAMAFRGKMVNAEKKSSKAKGHKLFPFHKTPTPAVHASSNSFYSLGFAWVKQNREG